MAPPLAGGRCLPLPGWATPHIRVGVHLTVDTRIPPYLFSPLHLKLYNETEIRVNMHIDKSKPISKATSVHVLLPFVI